MAFAAGVNVAFLGLSQPRAGDSTQNHDIQANGAIASTVKAIRIVPGMLGLKETITC